MTPPIAIVGMACRYPDARSPADVWDNALSQRRAFRRLPKERLDLDEYWSADRGAVDATYSTQAAVLEGYEFDRTKFRVAGSTFRATDMAHWLALEVASEALADAGFAGGNGLPAETTGVLVGNSLTGEFSRASLMRLRWPYVRRVLTETLQHRGWSAAQRTGLLSELEQRYKAPFPDVGDESLAGGLSNTIAGRICNHFDLGGGGYTVDGACASSLLAIANCCSALTVADLDVAIAGGVDLSLDPFELVGFAKIGALAEDMMRVFDAKAAGFWPGEGCGMVVLMRLQDAINQCRRIYAVVRGWGVSSDGSGGITRPKIGGQQLALHRAYRRAAIDIGTVGYFEGHGTGTAVGDAIELRALSQTRHQSKTRGIPAAVGSIKANIGHTKAAAGVAGFIKAALAVQQQIIPPSSGWENAHPAIAEEGHSLRLVREGQIWPAELPLLAGVSAMGFGGINAHIVMGSADEDRRTRTTARERNLLGSDQDAELFLLSGHDIEALAKDAAHLHSFADRLSRCELIDLAGHLSDTLGPGSTRAAIVAGSPRELKANLETLLGWLAERREREISRSANVMLECGDDHPRIGFVFPGQGSPANLSGGIWARRFEPVAELYRASGLSPDDDAVATEIAQPAIAVASLAGLSLLSELGVQANVAIGHSLGEIAAYHWAGAFDESALQRIAAGRGKAIAECSGRGSAMASISASEADVKPLVGDSSVVFAGFNTPQQTVISGDTAAVETVLAKAQARGFKTARLPVSHAFHSPSVAAAVPRFSTALAAESFARLSRPVSSTVSGQLLESDVDLRELLARQVTSPVLFLDAFRAADQDIDLWIEVGPGQVLRGIVGQLTDTRVLSLDAGGSSLRGLLQTLGTSYVLGAPVEQTVLFNGRFRRVFNLDWQPKFLANPCAQILPSDSNHTAESGEVPTDPIAIELNQEPPSVAKSPDERSLGESGLETVRRLAAERAELPLSSVGPEDRLLSDLHLTSLAVGQLFSEAARALELPPPVSPTDAADATVSELAAALAELARQDGSDHQTRPVPAGVDSWVRAFSTEWIERTLPRGGSPQEKGDWSIIAPECHPLARRLAASLAGASMGSGVALCLPTDFQDHHTGLLIDAARQLLDRCGKPKLRLKTMSMDQARAGKASTLDSCSQAPTLEPCSQAPAWEHTAPQAPPAEPNTSAYVARQEPRPPGPATPETKPKLVVALNGGIGASFAKTVALELSEVNVTIVDVPFDHDDAATWVAAEAAAAVDYCEVRYDRQGVRREPVLRLVELPDEAAVALDADDVLLVTGGGKGIAAECAYSLAQETGVRLALVGRSRVEDDVELQRNLARFKDAGVTFCYSSADVTDAGAIRKVVENVVASWGPVTAVLHAAGVNHPQPLDQIDEESISRTVAPKVHGARHILSAIDPEQLRMFVAFGSIIGRSGLPGQAEYALANEWLTRLVDCWRAEYPHCHWLAVEWSVWDGVGMGQRLGRIEALRQQGINPISIADGVGVLHRLLGSELASPVVVTGRYGELPTLQFDVPDLPLLRFLEQPRAVVPGVELIVDSDLSLATDPYLGDHVYQNIPLLPAVVGLEAMAQTVMALTGWDEPPVFEQVTFDHPVLVSDGPGVTIRLAALATQSGSVEVNLRSSETGFQQDHFRAVCRRCTVDDRDQPEQSPELAAEGLVTIDPRRDLYGGILFHTGRFRRLTGYRQLQARQCVAEISPDDDDAWFGPYLPPRRVLGDAAARDAIIHAVQACIPHGTLLPVGVDRLVPAANLIPPVTVLAKEVSQEGDNFIYDVLVCGDHGQVLERWDGLRLRRVDQVLPTRDWPPALLGPYLERRIVELISPEPLSVVVRRNGAATRNERSRTAVAQAIGAPVELHRRPDGKPEIAGNAATAVSTSHSEELTMAVSGDCVIGCDAETIEKREARLWRDLLGSDGQRLGRLIADRSGDDDDAACTRVWSAQECLKKAGAAADAPLLIDEVIPDGWVLLRSGNHRVATWSSPPDRADRRRIFAVSVRT